MEGMCFSLSLPSCSFSSSSSFARSNHRHRNYLQFLMTCSTSSVVSVRPNYHSRHFLSLPTSAAPASASVLYFSAKDKKEAKEEEEEEEGATVMPKLDKAGRFCSPRAARELSL